jgi:glycosyltransferase involved in cell wall biosynthesis
MGNKIEKEQLNYHTFQLMDNTPKISVLMTVYNTDMFIREAIESILNQTFKDFELIIVNDGSTDKTKEIIREYMKKDKRIVYLENPINLGFDLLFKTVNKGLEIAKGRYIARLDADDYSYPNRLQVQYDYLEKHPKIFMIGSSAVVIDKYGNELERIIKRQWIPSWIYKYRVGISNSFIHSSIMFRNEKIKYQCNPDHPFYLLLIYYKKRLKNIKNILVKYRINPGGIMANYSDLSLSKYKKLYEDKGIKNVRKK